MLFQRQNLRLFHAGTEKTGGLDRKRQASRQYLPDAIAPVPSPIFNQGITVDVLLVGVVKLFGMFVPPHFPGIVAQEAVDLLAPRPCLPAGRIVIAELFLRPDLVLLGTSLVAVGDGRQGAGAQALHFQGQPVAAAVVLLHHRDLRHTVSGQPIIHRADELIGVGLFAACVGK